MFIAFQNTKKLILKTNLDLNQLMKALKYNYKNLVGYSSGPLWYLSKSGRKKHYRPYELELQNIPTYTANKHKAKLIYVFEIFLVLHDSSN